jgi:DNA-binding MarR family transcriptional regulator
MLALFEQGELSATEVRVLLALVERTDASIAEVAEDLGTRPTEITRAGRRLAMRGLVRKHYAGRAEQPLMEITPSGLATVRTLLTAAASATAKPPARARAIDEPHQADRAYRGLRISTAPPAPRVDG